MNTPKITIITVTYNAATTLPTTMASLHRQRCREFQHIVVDGASTDGTQQIATDADILISEPDRGLYDAMNKGISRAAGEFLLFLNAGDAFADEDTLQRYCDAITPDTDIIYADTDLVDSEGRVIGHRHLSVPEQLTVGSFANGMLVCHQAFMVRRSIAPQFNLSYRFSADYEWCIRCMRATNPQRCVNLHCVAIHYLNEGVTTANHRRSLNERFRIMRDNYGLCPTLIRHIGFLFRNAWRKIKH
jgi:glycosyltransferase involved in cell wall biosynthesis